MQHDLKLDELFKDIVGFLDNGGEKEETESPDDADTDNNPDHFDLTDVFEHQFRRKVDHILTLCNMHGIPAQMCFLTRTSEEDGQLHQIFSTRTTSPVAQAAHAMYHLPHTISHLVQLMGGFPLFLLPSPDYSTEEQFDHESFFTDAVWPKVEELLNLCKDHNLSCQWGAVAKVSSDNAVHSMALVGRQQRVSCPMAAATVLYRLPPVIGREIVQLANEVGAFGDEKF